jgi:hypothetical protein
VHEVKALGVRTFVLAAMFTGLGLGTATPALAGPKECIAAADEGQKLRDDGKLNAARDRFILCADKKCPGVVAKQCSQWLIDGTAVLQSIEARALPIDPGEHVVRFELASGQGVEDKVILRPGEKNKMVELSFQPKAPPPPVAQPVTPPPPPVVPESRGFQVPLLGWVGLGVGVVGGVMTVAFAVSANSDESSLRSTCAPTCDSSKKSGIDTKVVLANVGLGIGLVGLGVAVVTTVLANTGPAAPPKSAAKSASGVGLDVAPGSVMVRGTF